MDEGIRYERLERERHGENMEVKGKVMVIHLQNLLG